MEYDSQISSLDQRIYKLESIITSPSAQPLISVFPNGITTTSILLGPTGQQITISKLTSPPTGLVLTPGSFYNDIFIDVVWTPPVDGSASVYEVQWYIKNPDATYTYVNALRTGGNSAHINTLKPNTTYGIRVYSINRVGVPSVPLPSAGFQDAATTHDATIPAAIAGLAVTTGLRSVVAQWNESADVDVAKSAGGYEVLLATAATVDGAGKLTVVAKDSYTSATIISFTDLASNTQYWVQVRAVDASGNAGPWTAVVTATTGYVLSGDVGFALGGGNLILNSSFELDANADGLADSWTAAGTAVGTRSISATWARFGTKSQRYQVTGGAVSTLLRQYQEVPLQAGDKIVASVYALISALNNSDVRLTLDFYDATNTIVQSTPQISALVDAVTPQRIVSAAVAPATAVKVRAYIGIRVNVAGGTGDASFDGFQLEYGDVVTAYAPRPDEILPGSIGSTEISDNAITSQKIIAGAVIAGKVAANAIGANEITAGSISSDKIVTAGLDAAVIKFGTLDGSLASIVHLKAYNIDSSSITAANITLAGGSLQAGSPPTTGLVINSQGLSLYNSGVRTMFLDATSGSVSAIGTLDGSTITGSNIIGSYFSTASTGARIEIAQQRTVTTWPNTQEHNTERMYFWSGSPNETGAATVYNNNTGTPDLILTSSTLSYAGSTTASLYVSSSYPGAVGGAVLSTVGIQGDLFLSGATTTVLGSVLNTSRVSGKVNADSFVCFNGIDLYQSTAAFIDLHRASNPAGDANADYNVRLINDAANQLSLLGGDMYINAHNLRAYNALVGNGFYGTSYAHFGYYTQVPNTGGYALMQQSTGETYVNTNAGSLHLRHANVDVMTIRNVSGATECKFPTPLPALTGNTAIYVTASTQLGYSSSSMQFKRKIARLKRHDHDNPVFDLVATQFWWSKEVIKRSGADANRVFPGFIAEQVEEVMPEAVWHYNGQPHGVNHDVLLAYIVAAIQRHERMLSPS